MLLTVQYQNSKEELPSEGVREVNFEVVDAEGATSAPFTVFVRVEQRNDAPSLNINDGNVTFTEGSPFGIHIVPHPHRIRVTDGDTIDDVTFNYITRLRVVLTYVLNEIMSCVFFELEVVELRCAANWTTMRQRAPETFFIG